MSACRICSRNADNSVTVEWIPGFAQTSSAQSDMHTKGKTYPGTAFSLSVCRDCLQKARRSGVRGSIWILGIGVAAALVGFFYLDSDVGAVIGGVGALIALVGVGILVATVTTEEAESAFGLLQEKAINCAREFVREGRNMLLWSRQGGICFLAATAKGPKVVDLSAARPIVKNLGTDEHFLDALGGEDWKKGLVLTNRRLLRFGFVLSPETEWALECLTAPFIVESITGAKVTVGVYVKEKGESIVLESQVGRECSNAFYTSLLEAMEWEVRMPNAESGETFVVTSTTAAMIRASFHSSVWPHECCVCGSPDVFKTISVSEKQKTSVGKSLALGPIGSTIFSGSFRADIPYCEKCYPTASDEPGVAPVFIGFTTGNCVYFSHRPYAEAFLKENGISLEL